MRHYGFLLAVQFSVDARIDRFTDLIKVFDLVCNKLCGVLS